MEYSPNKDSGAGGKLSTQSNEGQAAFFITAEGLKIPASSYYPNNGGNSGVYIPPNEDSLPHHILVTLQRIEDRAKLHNNSASLGVRDRICAIDAEGQHKISDSLHKKALLFCSGTSPNGLDELLKNI